MQLRPSMETDKDASLIGLALVRVHARRKALPRSLRSLAIECRGSHSAAITHCRRLAGTTVDLDTHTLTRPNKKVLDLA